VEEALRHDPGSVMALRSAMEGKPEAEALAMAERATAAHPDDARAWLLLVSVAPAERREAALRKAVEFDSWSGVANNELAWLLLESGRQAEALPFAKRAVELAPGYPSHLGTLAGVAEARGHCQPALDIQRRAVDLLPENLDEKGRAPYLERLARLEKSCGGAGQAQPARQPAMPPSGTPAVK
jgi:tetratricopeptide (TPR) repeat protein